MLLPGAERMGCHLYVAHEGTERVADQCCANRDVPQPRAKGDVGCQLTAPVRCYHYLKSCEGLQTPRVMDLMVALHMKYQ